MCAMFDGIAEKLTARFGAAGLRRLTAEGAGLPADQAALLQRCGVPRHVGPYFASSDGEPEDIGAYHAQLASPVPDGIQSAWCRIGWDRGGQFFVDDSGAVRVDFIGLPLSGGLVNESLGGFLESLIALDETIDLLAAARGVPESAEQIRVLLKRLANIEIGTIQGPDTWWSRVVEDLRHTASHAAFAAFEIEDGRGEPRIVTDSGALCLHPEERIWRELHAAGAPADRVKKVHTELEPCFMPGHYCAVWMVERFGGAEFTHSFDYGRTAGSRESGFLELVRHAAASRD